MKLLYFISSLIAFIPIATAGWQVDKSQVQGFVPVGADSDGNPTNYVDATANGLKVDIGTTSGAVAITNTVTVTGPLTDAQLRGSNVESDVKKLSRLTSTANSSTTNLTILSQEFNGTSEDVTGYNTVDVSLNADQGILVNVMQSDDGINWDLDDPLIFDADTPDSYSIRIVKRYLKIRAALNVFDGPTTFFRLATSYSPDANGFPRTLWSQGALPVLASANSLPLPTGAATAARQDTGNTSVASIDTKTPSLVGGRVPVDIATMPSTAVTNTGTFAVQATLGAETTKVIGTVNQGTNPWLVKDVSGVGITNTPTVNQGTSPWVTRIPTGVGITNTPAVSQSGTWTVQPGNTANSTPWIIGVPGGVGITNTPSVNQGTNPWLVKDIGGVAITNTPTVNQGTSPWITSIPGGVGITNTAAITGFGGVSLTSTASISLGISAGKTNVWISGTATTTSTIPNQVVATYTVTSGKTFYLNYLSMEARLTALSLTGAYLGTMSLETPSGTKTILHNFDNATTETVDRANPYMFPEPIPISSGTVVRAVCNPAASTSTNWQANFGGYEK